VFWRRERRADSLKDQRRNWVDVRYMSSSVRIWAGGAAIAVDGV